MRTGADDWEAAIETSAAEVDPPYVPGMRVGDYLVPGRFTASIDHPSLPLRVELAVSIDPETRAVSCSRMTCTDTESMRGVTGAKLRRIPVERIIRAALASAAQDAQGRLLDWTPGASADFQERLTVADPEARWALTEDHLRNVARVYREAVARRDRAPVQAVAAHFRRPRATAARWVQRAREEGLLGQTVRGLRGEQDNKSSGRQS